MVFKTFEEEQKEMHLNMYKYILDGRQNSFPYGFWNENGRKETFKMLLLYYLHDVLGHPKDKVPYLTITKTLIDESKLGTAYKYLFKNRIEVMFKEIFPEAFPYYMPFISDELWNGTGMWIEDRPLKEIFPNWYFKEYLGFNEDNVIGLYNLSDNINKEEERYRHIVKTKYRSIAECMCIAFPSKDIEKVKSGIKARTTSRIAQEKKKLIDPNYEFRQKLILYKSDDNCYFTNTECNIYSYVEDGLRKLKIVNYNRMPTDREIEFIKDKLIENILNISYSKVSEYSNEIILIEEKNQ